MNNRLGKKEFTTEKIRSGVAKYSIIEFADDFRKVLESDLAKVKEIDKNPKKIRRAMHDIFLLLANAPYIKQDMSDASRHYNISTESIETYFEEYHDEGEILLTLIDIEYERLLLKYGGKNPNHAIDDLNNIISKAAEIISQS